MAIGKRMQIPECWFLPHSTWANMKSPLYASMSSPLLFQSILFWSFHKCFHAFSLKILSLKVYPWGVID
ncbi:hypothetical protein MRB53_033833 [Persea americana]|uniref:Uncharacterized protein n=1 Tax=Persea americana TaxID=3435 RepID=A0ACC2KWD2_PERAE|nr:hypothetical protein MRB53_033833 [Persea americana]